MYLSLGVSKVSVLILCYLSSIGKDNICALDCRFETFICLWVDRNFLCSKNLEQSHEMGMVSWLQPYKIHLWLELHMFKQ